MGTLIALATMSDVQAGCAAIGVVLGIYGLVYVVAWVLGVVEDK